MDIRKFQLDSNYNILSCKVASKIKIQMLQFNGTLFRGIDETGPEIIIRDKKIRKKKMLPLQAYHNHNIKLLVANMCYAWELIYL